MRGLAVENNIQKTNIVHLINYVIRGAETMSSDVVARLETTLLSFTSALIDASDSKDGDVASPRSTDSLQKLVAALKTQLLRRFQDKPSSVVDHLLKDADSDLVGLSCFSLLAVCLVC